MKWHEVRNDQRFLNSTSEQQSIIMNDWFKNNIESKPQYKSEIRDVIWQDIFGTVEKAQTQIDKQEKIELPEPVEPEYEKLAETFPTDIVPPEPKPPNRVSRILEHLTEPSQRGAGWRPPEKVQTIPSVKLKQKTEEPLFESYARKIKRSEDIGAIEKRVTTYKENINKLDIATNSLNKFNEYIKNGEFIGDESQYKEYQNVYNQYQNIASQVDSESINQDIQSRPLRDCSASPRLLLQCQSPSRLPLPGVLSGRPKAGMAQVYSR